eukprot:CAMPEP_0174309188 /NCGR_PEP_ID=MMETSP0810-20121108/2240_1 /TAXON_ID=73025 ORGANISM="Eutreptiella gymnastica-like, Strain CCMP1594" /NCGR_SAMPLE_ID=MMETSP0810 /ASSEMBLY_ACC=CAM_ASM_000659 /LENGTH=38 /DNA_ID= /DNA_START= /DNA_END= /DNA_ORIENTATION=
MTKPQVGTQVGIMLSEHTKKDSQTPVPLLNLPKELQHH